MQQHFHRIMSREIARDYGVMLLLGSMRAEERLAAFLLNLSQRFAARGPHSNAKCNSTLWVWKNDCLLSPDSPQEFM